MWETRPHIIGAKGRMNSLFHLSQVSCIRLSVSDKSRECETGLRTYLLFTPWFVVKTREALQIKYVRAPSMGEPSILPAD